MDKIFFIPDVKKIVKIKEVTIDNLVFRLHYRVTALCLVVASLMISATQFFGDPIKCVLPDPKFFPVGVVETYCWVESTFTLPKALDKKVGLEVPYPGVDKHVEGEDTIVHSYYQWVCVVLFIQACLFFLPHVLWKGWEDKKMQSLFMQLNKPSDNEKERKDKYSTLTNYFVEHQKTHGDYFWKFFFCECFNFVNVVGQIFVIDKFLHGEFTTYGSEVFQFLVSEQEERVDPMIRVFPRMTKCTFHHYGPSGDIQKLDTFCVLPLNILNEKTYVFIWFWFVILAIITGLALVYRVVLFMSDTARLKLIKSVNFLTEEGKLQFVLDRLSYGDWFVLYQLSNNIDNHYFKELINEMTKGVEKLDVVRSTTPDSYTSSINLEPSV